MASDEGEEIKGFTCSYCGSTVVYNGNYFCPRRSETGGHFILDDTNTAWREIGYEMYVQLMKQRGKKPDSLESTCPPAGWDMGVRRG